VCFIVVIVLFKQMWKLTTWWIYFSSLCHKGSFKIFYQNYQMPLGACTRSTVHTQHQVKITIQMVAGSCYIGFVIVTEMHTMISHLHQSMAWVMTTSMARPV